MEGTVEWQLAVGAEQTTALYEPARDERALFVCAHGAGGHMRDRSMDALIAALRPHGISLVRFNFLYREHGTRRPDPMPRLMTCMSAVVEHVRRTLSPRTLLLGGRSMGGRTASMLAANGLACDGLLLYAYPLHPAAKPDKLRDAHLPSIRVPVLCVNGTRDALCQRELMEAVVMKLGPAWTQHWLEAADHSFHVLKASGRNDAEVMAEVAATTTAWLATVGADAERKA